MTNDEAPKEFCTKCGKDLGYSRQFTCLACRQKTCKRKGCTNKTATKSGQCHLHGKYKPKHFEVETGDYVVENTVTGFVYPAGEGKK